MMTPERRGHLIATVGIPASGKSTWAKAFAATDSNVRVISRDDIRARMYEPAYLLNTGDPSREAVVTAIQNDEVRTALAAGRTVVVADTNLSIDYLRVWQQVAIQTGCTFEVTLFEIPLAEAQRRNRLRERSLPAEVLTEMHERWVALIAHLAVLEADSNITVGPGVRLSPSDK